MRDLNDVAAISCSQRVQNFQTLTQGAVDIANRNCRAGHRSNLNLSVLIHQDHAHMQRVKVRRAGGQSDARAACSAGLKGHVGRMEHREGLVGSSPVVPRCKAKRRNLKRGQASPHKLTRHEQRMADKHHIRILSEGVFMNKLMVKWQGLSVRVLRNRGSQRHSFSHGIDDKDPELLMLKRDDVLLVARKDKRQKPRLKHLGFVSGDSAQDINALKAGTPLNPAFRQHEHILNALR